MRCAKCQGCLIDNYEGLFCINCGARPLMPTLPAPGPSPARQRVAGTCDCGSAAVRGKELCMVCRGRSRGEEHGEKVRIGMHAARAQREDG